MTDQIATPGTVDSVGPRGGQTLQRNRQRASLARLRPERVAAKAMRIVTARDRGDVLVDGRLSLLCVDWHLTEDVIRLGRSFRRHVGDGPMHVVQNATLSAKRRLRKSGWITHGLGLNVNHGTALDWGLRFVTSEFVLICDPDSVIVSSRFADGLWRRLRGYGVAGVVLSDDPIHQRYHPFCMAFRTELWKRGTWSMNPAWDRGPNWDVGAALTYEIGGLTPEAILSCTADAGGLGYLWADSFSNIVGGGRSQFHDKDFLMDGFRKVADARRYHEVWRLWADSVADGTADERSFPTGV